DGAKALTAERAENAETLDERAAHRCSAKALAERRRAASHGRSAEAFALRCCANRSHVGKRRPSLVQWSRSIMKTLVALLVLAFAASAVSADPLTCNTSG